MVHVLRMRLPICEGTERLEVVSASVGALLVLVAVLVRCLALDESGSCLQTTVDWAASIVCSVGKVPVHGPHESPLRPRVHIRDFLSRAVDDLQGTPVRDPLRLRQQMLAVEIHR